MGNGARRRMWTGWGSWDYKKHDSEGAFGRFVIGAGSLDLPNWNMEPGLALWITVRKVLVVVVCRDCDPPTLECKASSCQAICWRILPVSCGTCLAFDRCQVGKRILQLKGTGWDMPFHAMIWLRLDDHRSLNAALKVRESRDNPQLGSSKLLCMYTDCFPCYNI